MKNAVRTTVYLGLLASLALILAYLEMLLPPLFSAVPGIKLGLPNVVILFVLYRFGWKKAAAVSAVRLAAVALLFGNVMTLSYSAAGAFLSLLGMALLKKADFLSAVGVSVAGAVLHNLGQVLVAILLLGTAELGYYLIVLTVTGTVTGIFVGLLGGLAVRRLPHISLKS